VLDARQFEIQGRHAGDIAGQYKSNASASINVPCSMASYPARKRILDARGRPAMPGHLQAVVVRGGDDRIHFVECHAQRVVIVRIGGMPRRPVG